MKKYKNLIKFVCFTVILVLLLSAMNYVLRNKNEANIVSPYYDERKNSLDVVFIGSSHIMCGVFPMDLWNDYGITSYDYASSALVLPQSYYQVIEALKTQDPEVVVIDVSGAVYENTKVGTKEYVHVQLDNMKWSLNKINAINDLIENPADRLEYYFPFVKFHSRWKELHKTDFQLIDSITKGAYIIDGGIEVDESFTVMPKEYTEPMSEYADSYLRKILDYCKKQGKQVLLLNTPTVATIKEQGNYNAVYAVAKEYNVPYLNLMHELETMEFDFEKDMRDDYHCNTKGGLKVTKFVGEYLKQNYNLPDRREDSNYSDWQDLYNQYKQTYTY